MPKMVVLSLTVRFRIKDVSDVQMVGLTIQKWFHNDYLPIQGEIVGDSGSKDASTDGMSVFRGFICFKEFICSVSPLDIPRSSERVSYVLPLIVIWNIIEIP